MHLFLATIKRKVPDQLSGVPSGAKHEGTLLIMCSEREADTPQFLTEVFAVEGSSPGGIRRLGHCPGYQSPVYRAST
jgi:hypothetical protein